MCQLISRHVASAHLHALSIPIELVTTACVGGCSCKNAEKVLWGMLKLQNRVFVHLPLRLGYNSSQFLLIYLCTRWQARIRQDQSMIMEGKVILLVMPTRRWKELVCFFLADFMGSIGRLKLKKTISEKTVLNDCHLEGKPTWTVGGAMRRKIIAIEYKWLREINQVEMKMHAIWKKIMRRLKKVGKIVVNIQERQTSSKFNSK